MHVGESFLCVRGMLYFFHMVPQGIVALAAFSFLLRKDGQTSAAEYYEGLNKGFIDYWMKNALVKTSIIPCISCFVLKLTQCRLYLVPSIQPQLTSFPVFCSLEVTIAVVEDWEQG